MNILPYKKNAPRSQRKAYKARNRRLNTWMPRLQAAMAYQKKRGLFDHSTGIHGMGLRG